MIHAKKIGMAICLLVMVAALIGCETSSNKDAKKLKFTNSSTYGVQVIPLTTEWSGFYMEPGEEVSLKDIRDVDYTFQPEFRVKKGSASTERHVIFVNIR